ncbi:uncharacterized protein BCR38DRAFT_481948 [Pseudomassariella vexata]|uniref:Uncharacterized protein n=1 Tax=Pseudomassariella vexata TaxID=1141098 RepID=A0A1Y2EA68_9PEZI|nr:uncharacterized protein BCR38DRAFT_481948 [Pseudomassariella vexata]ORY68463.1 hypothetical protein BCR38DRAFT_481948 [Pseudomassariella vexata]
MEVTCDGDTSDVGALWRQALDNYQSESGLGMRNTTQIQWSIDAIKNDQEKEVTAFRKYRHNQSRVDKIRTMFVRNADIISIIASMLQTQPVRNAFKNVSDNYDMIESAFDVMHGFVQRLSLLEDKFPLRRKAGRFSKWAKSLVDHQDPKLKGAYNVLQKYLSRLGSMTLTTTFKQTLVLYQKRNNSGYCAIKEGNGYFKIFAKRSEQENISRKDERPAGAGSATMNPGPNHLGSGTKKAAAFASLRGKLDCQAYVNSLRDQEIDLRVALVKVTLPLKATKYRDHVLGGFQRAEHDHDDRLKMFERLFTSKTSKARSGGPSFWMCPENPHVQPKRIELSQDKIY